MNSRDVFEAHYRSADVLLRVYRLLESEQGPLTTHRMMPAIRTMLASAEDEEIILLLNELFVGVVRDRADLKPSFFRRETLDLLLRQSVVAACSALDVFVPHLLQSHLSDVIHVRQRNFLPNDGDVKQLFGDFRLKLEDIWPLAEEGSAEERWNMITRRILDHCSTKTLSNDSGITATMALLAVEKPWTRIAERAGESESSLRDKLKRIVSRRNDIVHRADRAKTAPDGPAQDIDFVWTQNHVGAVKTIVLACYDLARERVRDLQANSVA
jgi:HEPN superfamily RiboL-PSP-like protein